VRYYMCAMAGFRAELGEGVSTATPFVRSSTRCYIRLQMVQRSDGEQYTARVCTEEEDATGGEGSVGGRAAMYR
jgi:hypothetical protein